MECAAWRESIRWTLSRRLRVGAALAIWVAATNGRGPDPKWSSEWIRANPARGSPNMSPAAWPAAACKARFAGLITTPGIAHVARTGPFAAGVMISASHNPYQDNGIKIIDHSGFKLPDEQEHVLERDIFACLSGARRRAGTLSCRPTKAWTASTSNIWRPRCRAVSTGMRIVVDARQRGRQLSGARAVRAAGRGGRCIGCAPDGSNINLNCGSLHLEGLRETVLDTGADVGVAFDGDADRALFVSHSGKIVDGDAVMLSDGAASARRAAA